MTLTQMLDELKKLTVEERLWVAEMAIRLIREELFASQSRLADEDSESQLAKDEEG